MSSSLQLKIKQHQAQKKVDEILKQVRSLRTFQFCNEMSMISTEVVWSLISQIDLNPVSKISVDTLREKLEEWLIKQLSGLPRDEKFYISLGGLAFLPWIEIKADDSQWFVSLWQLLEKQEIVVLAKNQTMAFAITNEEDVFESYLIEIASQH